MQVPPKAEPRVCRKCGFRLPTICNTEENIRRANMRLRAKRQTTDMETEMTSGI
jgi:hypothetical protein